MSEYIILTDSSCDLPAALAREKGIEYIPLTVRMGGREYRNELDDGGPGSHMFYEKLRGGAQAKTSAPASAAFEEIIERYAAEGKDVLYLGFSSGLSSTYSSGCIAMAAVQEKHPERKLIAVDTLCASLGQGLLVLLAQRQREQGATIEQTAQYVEENKLHLCHWFTVSDLDFLHRGGRVSATSAMLGSILNIRPLMHVDNEGHLTVVSKVRGQKAVLQKMLDRARKTAFDPGSQIMAISHGDCEADALQLRDMVQAAFGVKEVIVSPVGPVIGAHAGPGVLAFFFLGSER